MTAATLSSLKRGPLILSQSEVFSAHSHNDRDRQENTALPAGFSNLRRRRDTKERFHSFVERASAPLRVIERCKCAGALQNALIRRHMA
jgi:hypothetical protein